MAQNDDVRASLLAAAKDLLADRAPSAISGRAIASRGGVSYSHLHRRFESREALLREALTDLLDAMHLDAFTPGAVVPTPGVLGRHRPFVSAAAHAMLDQASLDLRGRVAIIERYQEGLRILRPELDADAADALVALSCSMQFGTQIHGASLAGPATVEPSADLDRAVVLLVEQIHAGRGPFADPQPSPRCLVARGPVDDPSETLDNITEVTERLIFAARRLLEDRAPAAISGRKLADAAGVNYGLIHHHFSSANDILGLASTQLRRRYVEAETAADGMPDFFSATAHPGYVRGVTYMALDESAPLGDSFPAVQAALERQRARAGSVSNQFKVNLLISMAAQLAWALFAPLLDASLDRDTTELQPIAAAYLARVFRD